MLVSLLTACATYQTQYEATGRERPESFSVPYGELSHRTYLLGDAGNAAEGEVPQVLAYLKTELAQAGDNTTVLFLGDNIYPGGFPPEGHPERPIAEHRLNVQIAAVKGYAGNNIWIPGNHDWYRFGIDGLKEQRRYLRETLGQRHVWEPDVRCGGPEVVQVNDNLVYLIIDTQWYLTNWKRHPGVNEDCAAGNRTEFLRLIREAFRSNKEKQIIVAMHHPMETYGRHGGHFTVGDHLKPLPILGSFIPFIRGNVGTPQDNLNARFQELRQQLIRIAKINGNATFVSGHEHNMQYIEKDRQRYVVSGAVSKSGPAFMGEGSRFASGKHGYGVLDLYADGSLWLSFFSVNENGTQKELLYRKEISPPSATDQYEAPESYSDYPITEPTLTAQLVRDNYDRNAVGKVILGDHYRDAYGLSLDLPNLDLSTYKGGLTPVKVGGGSQTITLRLRADDGREYTMRSLDKDPKATLGARLSRSKVIQALIEDGFTAAHPIAALPVADLAEAAGINHTNPEVYFVPSQPALGKYNPTYGDKVYLLEERPDDEDWMSYADFGKPQDIRSTDQVLKALRKHPDHLLDNRSIARARAFDFLIGDWDRHDDQWRWKEEKRADGRTYYSPIPRDRDQAFSHYDGALLGLARRIIPDISPLKPFTYKAKLMAASTRGARFFDATFLAGISWDMWEAEVRHLQQQLTDEVIEQAFTSSWSAEVMEAGGNEIVSKLKVRRDQLLRMTRDVYKMRAATVEVVGTDKDDFFQIDLRDNGEVRIRVKSATTSINAEPYYDRIFYPKVTKEIILFGLEDDDRFVFTGATRPKMQIRIVGGPDEDEVTYGPDGDRPRLSKVKYYDYREETEPSKIDDVKDMQDRRNPAAKYNIYSRLAENKDLNFFSLLPMIGLNPDNGLLVGAIATRTTYGFKKEPFATRQRLIGRVASGTGGVQLKYKGEFTDMFGDKELLVESRLQSALFGVNFYGFGNETVNNEDTNELGRDFNRVRQQVVSISPLIMKRVNPAATYAFGPEYSIIETQRTEGRFLAVNSDDPEDEGIFSNYHYVNLLGRLEFDNRIPDYLPGRGISFFAEGGYKLSVAGPGASFPYVRGSITFNQKVDTYGDLTIANRVGYHQVFTDDLAYFQAATIGGSGNQENIRGFRQERFSGNKAFYFNSDIRYRLLGDRKGALPASIGVLLGYDVGRVWLNGERSEVWHYSYGGGLFISPLDYTTVTFSYFFGDGEVGRFSFETGFFF